MKRFITGFLCGALLFGGTAVLADSVSLVGKKVDGEVSVFYNDEPLAAKAITVEGTSYLPVRTVGNTLGAKIEYRDGAVYVEQVDEYDAIKEKVLKDIQVEMKKEELRKELEKLQKAVENNKKLISELEKDIELNSSQGFDVSSLIRVKETTEAVNQQNLQKIKELEAQLAELEGQEDGENQDQE